jgi:ubiquinol-cytochrome c reductase cytochrome b subunit
MRILKNNALLRLYNSYIVDSPQPANISYFWNFGSLLAMCLALQILTGCFLAMHYVANIDLAFDSVEHIMRDVSNGYIIRYVHANVASFFFIFVYAHIARNIFYGSFKSPRILVWSIGVIILILMMAIAFLGYVLPYGQMSLWGLDFLASNAILIYNYIFQIVECLGDIFYPLNFNYWVKNNLIYSICIITKSGSNPIRVRALNRIGPHNFEILSIIFGTLLGDGHAEHRSKGNGTRINFYQEAIHNSYLIWLHELVSSLGYCNTITPKINTRLGKHGKIRKIIRFSTWTYSSFNWIHDLWYVNGVKIVPKNIGNYLTPLALAIWIMDDGAKVNKSLKLCTNSFSYSDCLFLSDILFKNFSLKSSIQSAGAPDQYNIYILKSSMDDLRKIVLPYIHSSMKYKLYN